MKAFRVLVRDQDEDEATAILAEAGTTGIEVTTGSRFRRFPSRLLRAVPSAFRIFKSRSGSVGTAHVTEEAVPTVDWVARFREGFRGFRAGAFEVVPVWDALAASVPPNPHRLVVDPGRAFGTGTHETTRLCLAAIEAEAQRRPLRRVIDVGTGTGLLAVAAARLGAALVAGVDNDPEAVASARRHAELNAVRLFVVPGRRRPPLPRLRLRPRPGQPDGAAPRRAPPRARRRSWLPRARWSSPGSSSSDLPEVRAAYAHLGRPSEATDGEWAALTFRRSAA